MKKKCLVLILVAALLTGILCGCRIGGREVVFEGTPQASYVFSVNKINCSEAEAKLYLCNYKNLYGTAYGVDLWGYDFGEQSLEDYVKSVTIDELSRIYCMEQIAKAQGIELTGAEKKEIKNLSVDYYHSLTGDEIKYMNISREQIEEFYTRYALARKLYRSMTQDVSTEVSDDDARVIRINQIMVSDEQKAQEVAQKLAAGNDFMAVAGSYNEAEEIELTVARGTLPKEVEAVAFEMDNDQISQQISCDQGCYFIQCLNKFEQELTEANKSVIQAAREQEQFENAYRSFIEEAEFELNKESWSKVHLPEEGSAIETSDFFSRFENTFYGEEQ